jgi:hypothetical protein
MHPLSASDLLDVWERGAGRTPVEQGLVLLAYAFPRAPFSGLAGLTVGQRDACLLQLRALTFGPHLQGVVSCPACGERLEMSFEAGGLLRPDAALPDPEAGAAQPEGGALTLAPYEVAFRLPTSADLRAAARLDDPNQARRELLQACLVDVRKDGQTVPAGELPAAVLEAVDERIGQAEPMADLNLSATCPACGHAWHVLFDIVSFFWSEIEARAARLMGEVHVLASVYGWREADILALSPWRRQRYLELSGT